MSIAVVTAADPEAASADLVVENLAALRTLFPDAFPDGKIDFEALRQLLGDEVEDGDERYGLNWSGKRQARRLALTPSMGTLLPAKADSIDWGETKNLVIEGDNLEVLKLLQKSYAGRVKLVYIDPPYNTGHDFVYPDDYSESLANYLRRTGQSDGGGVKNTSNPEGSGRFHTDWLNLIYPRLMLARTILREDGIILVSIDEKEFANLNVVMDSIFGRENFVGAIAWKGATDNNPTRIAIEHEYVLCYVKNSDVADGVWKNNSDDAKTVLLAEHERLRDLELSVEEIQKGIRSFIRANRDALLSITHYDRVDSGGLYTGSRKVHNPKPGGYKYDVIHPITGRVCVPPVNGYRYPESTMKELIASGRILFGDDENQIIQVKEYLADYQGKLSSVIMLDSRAGANEIVDLFDVQKLFTNPKPTRFLADLFSFVVRSGDIVVDFFAGSGSTGHAVMSQNAADGGDRRYILVQLPEPLDPSNKDQKAGADFCDRLGKPRNIAELTKERLRRSAAKIRSEIPDTKADLGFRVYKLAESNLKAWRPGADLKRDLLDAADNLVRGRTEDDLLVELLLKRGIDLAEPELTREIAGRTVHAFGSGVLVVCLADVRTDDAEALADGIAEWVLELNPIAPAYIFFRDVGFQNDVAKANVDAILRQRLNDRGPNKPDLLDQVRSV